ncbi:MAG: pyridoxamine 5'-phosphate oxidase family protein, partial [Oscillospiraceae bacterium]|nr:pyridoxamine 5'-phosphate oxidase family protein [Oscillospiraceae bacterium]
MRRVELELTEKQDIEEIIKGCNTIRIGMISEGMPYILPMVFGYTWTGKYPDFYLHCGVAGRKNDALVEGAKICFEMDIEGPLTGRTPYANGYSREFCSIMGEGTVHFAESAEEKMHYFSYLMEHQTGRSDYTYQPGWLALTKVFCITVTKLSAARKGM